MAEPNLSASDLGLTKLNQWMDSNFWTRPEGKAAKVILAFAGLALAAGLVSYLPAILSYILFVLQTTTQIVLNVGYLFAAYMVLTSKRLHMLIGVMFRSAVRRLTNIFVSMAPVDVARDIIRQSYKNIEKAVEAIKQFKVQMALITKEVKVFADRYESQEAVSKKLLRDGKRDEAALRQGQAEKTKMRLQNLKAMQQKMEVVCRTLEQMYGKARQKLDAAQTDLEDQIRTRTMMMEGQQAIRKLKSAVMGSSTQNEMFDMAVTQIALDVADAVVEIDDFVTMGAELFDSVDMEEAKFSERAIKQIEDWERKSQSAVLAPGEKRAILDDARNPNVPYDATQTNPRPAAVNQRFSPDDFFSN